MGDDAECTIEELCGLLAPTLGQERAEELARSAVDSLGIPEGSFSIEDGMRVLERLGQMPGVIGSVTRFARARFTLRLPPRGATGSLRPPGGSKAPPPPPPKMAMLKREELTSLLTPTLGEEKSDEVVREAMERLGFPYDELSLDEGLAVLETIARSPGIVGVVSRFAKVRLLMRSTRT